MTSGRLTRLYRVVGGLGALALLAALVAGIPWALWHFVGWPLPHHLPTAAQVGRALDRQGIPAQALVDALAVVVWLTWAALMASLAAEIPAALSGRRARRLPLAGAFQPLTGHLVAAVAVACLALAPRPGHLDTPGQPGGRLALVTARRPAAALVLDRADLTGGALIGATRPSPVAAAPVRPAAGPPPSGAPPAPSAQNAAARTYVVQRGDTLWGIAERELGDPLQWQTIYQLNEGRPQPGGATLTDPHWIDPGWTLLLPPAATATPTAAAPAAPPTTTPPAPPSGPAPPSPPPAAHTTPDATSPPSTIPATPTTAPSATNGSAHHTTRSSEPVRLPSGSIVAGSFAAGVLAAAALGRLRRRHTYRYRPPRPGRNLTPPPIRPTLDRLAHASRSGDVEADVEQANGVPVFPFTDDERRLQPGQIEIGTRDGEAVTLEVTDLSGLSLSGPNLDAAVRALLASLVVRAGPRAAEVVLTEDLSARLLPGLQPNPDMRVVASSDDAARVVETERIARTRRLAAVDAPNAERFRTENPENPLPALLVLLDDVPAESLGRWSALLAGAPELGVAVLFLSDSQAASGRLVLDARRTVTSAEPAAIGEQLRGVELFGLEADETVEVLRTVDEANEQDEEDDPWDQPDAAITALHPSEPTGGVDLDPGEEPWPDALRAEGPERGDRPLAVQVLGPLRITAFGRPVSTGLRARAQTLLAWALLRPEGATIDEIVDALWPDTAPDRVLKQFWHPLGDLRTYFRGPDKEGLDVLEKVGEHYRPSPAEIACDLWDFQGALGDAAHAGTDEAARAALQRAVDAYRGDLLTGNAERWVEPVRQDLHRRAVDAHLRLADLEDRAGRPDAAVAVLERIIDLDRYAEEPYRRLMNLHAAHGRLDAVTATWQLLQRRLADLDVDVDEATARLYRTLVAPAPAPGPPRQPRPVRLTS